MRATAAAARLAALAAVLAGIALAAAAVDRLSVTVEDVAGPGWTTGPVQLTLALDGEGHLAVQARARSLVLPGPAGTLREASLSCPAASWQASRVRCDDAVLELVVPDGPPLRLAAVVDVDTTGGRIRVQARHQPLAGGHLDLTLDLGGGVLGLQLTLAQVQIPGLQRAAASMLDPGPLAASAGSVSGQVRLRAGARNEASVALQVRGLAFSDASGLRAGEGLDADLALSATGRGETWSGEGELSVAAGVVYVDPLLVEIGGDPVRITGRGSLGAGGELRIPALRLADPRGATVSGEARLGLDGGGVVHRLAVKLEPVDAGRLYERYLKAFAGAGALADLQLQGMVSGQLEWAGNGPRHAVLALDQVDVGDAAGRFTVLGLDGRLEWAADAPVAPCGVGWRGAQVYSLDLGPARARMVLQGATARLDGPLEVPLLDGALRIERLEARGVGTPRQRLEADLSLAPLSLQRLSDRLAWLPLSGTVAGSFPRMVYEDGRLAVGGDVRMDLFDGTVTVTGLSLEEPFGVVPRLRADATVRGIDLAVLTRAFSFGSIEGRLDGRVSDLVLEAWQPVTFDAVLATPPGDTSKHRISQRAVDNLASLGGANAVLSSTFLRFFQEFSYDRLGLSCRLRAGVCQMGGVAPANPGYYIVKGGGLPPRVDVVGFNTNVDWRTLLDRLKAVAGTKGPVIR